MVGCDRYFTSDEAAYKVKWDYAIQLCKEIAETRPDFRGLDSGLSTQTLRQLKLLRLLLTLRCLA
eukprot:4212451-Amphidinium_carterae.2